MAIKIVSKIVSKIRYVFVKPYKENIEFLKCFKNSKKCYILGGAPSINNLNLTNLEKDAMVITMGNFYEHSEINKINPSVHIFAASHPPITQKVLINWWTRCNEILPKNTSLLIEKRDKKIAKTVFKGRKIYYYGYGGKLPVNFTRPIMSPWSVTIVAVQLAVYCKIKKTFLLGINHDWQCIKKYTHFYDHTKPSLEFYLKKENIKISYEEQKQPFPKERLYREYELYQQYETLKIEGEKNGKKFYNADPFSDFDVFNKIKLTHILKK